MAHKSEINENKLKTILWPIARRTPTYLRLAWALVREPAIPQRHKLMIYGMLVYQVTPIHFVVSPIPVVGQLDGIVLLLLGIRQMVEHCPPRVARRHFARLNLAPNQFNEDLKAVQALCGDAAKSVARRIGSDARFAGRVAGGLSKRMMFRLATWADAKL
jgi:uncharacterized membrane protein YkvA (DUF1232 family)